MIIFRAQTPTGRYISKTSRLPRHARDFISLNLADPASHHCRTDLTKADLHDLPSGTIVMKTYRRKYYPQVLGMNIVKKTPDDSWRFIDGNCSLNRNANLVTTDQLFRDDETITILYTPER